MADDLNPITRTETFLAGNEPDLTPITREEVILAGGDLDPVTRKEWFLKKYRGGGNPNSQQSITGTVANPWGNVSYSEIAAALYSEDAHATIAFEFNGMQVKILLASVGSNVYGSAATIGGDVANSFSVVLTWSTIGEIYFAKAIMGGQLQDLISYTPGLTSYLNIYWHPMP